MRKINFFDFLAMINFSKIFETLILFQCLYYLFFSLILFHRWCFEFIFDLIKVYLLFVYAFVFVIGFIFEFLTCSVSNELIHYQLLSKEFQVHIVYASILHFHLPFSHTEVLDSYIKENKPEIFVFGQRKLWLYFCHWGTETKFFLN